MEDTFELKGDANSGPGGPQRGRKAKHRLFDEEEIFFWGTFGGSNGPSLKELSLLASLGGATLVKSLSASDGPITVICNEPRTSEEVSKFTSRNPQVEAIVTPKWLLDSAGSFQIKPYDDYSLES